MRTEFKMWGLSIIAAGAIALGVGAAPAQAAPQVLALVADSQPVELNCHNGDCWAEFSAYCLQPDRRSPVHGTRYLTTADADLRAIGTTHDGRTVALNAAKDLTITALRTHVAVRVAVTADVVRDLGLAKVSVTVGQNVALVPVPVPGDENPQDALELELATGPLRALGDTLVDSEGDRVVAARLTSQMINALPSRGRVDAATRQTLWRMTTSDPRYATLTPSTVESLRFAWFHCDHGATYGLTKSMRTCLEGQHDSMIGYLNNQYWDAAKAGS